MLTSQVIETYCKICRRNGSTGLEKLLPWIFPTSLQLQEEESAVDSRPAAAFGDMKRRVLHPRLVSYLHINCERITSNEVPWKIM